MSDAQQSRHVSPWVDTMEPRAAAPTALDDTSPDVVVIGGGIVGMTTALQLQRAGQRVTVVEARDLSQSVTAHSTVKVTIGHGTLYSEIEKNRGFEAAATYAAANLAGFDLILELVRTLDIDCLLEQGHAHVVYAESAEEQERVEQEADTVARIGLQASSVTRRRCRSASQPRCTSTTRHSFIRRGTSPDSRTRSSTPAGCSSRARAHSMWTRPRTSATSRQRQEVFLLRMSSWQRSIPSSTEAASSHG